MTAVSKPRSIMSFNRLNLAATLTAIVNIFIHYAPLRRLAIAHGGSPAGPIVGIFFLGLSYTMFWFFIYRRGSRVANWLFVAVTAFASAGIPFNLPGVLAMGPAHVLIDGVSFLLQCAAMTMLFRGSAKAWLGRKEMSADA
ncbi:hypothetical protein [Sphingosinicella sp. BN140058]|uniref:hypothetical protein n=1 Tax=Sphingosinicella sp. BN140058 TaxID=1892855 RepID=UPI0010104853|nr:hypothetical protein [Sphingosinicella sp. BN140058]QAY78407.1 hypothetical protein ETR14_19095 [Sphingosinicella sp. BN140058]